MCRYMEDGKEDTTNRKKNGPIMSNFLDWFFQVFMGKKNQKHCSVFIKKLHKMKLKKYYRSGNIFNCVFLY